MPLLQQTGQRRGALAVQPRSTRLPFQNKCPCYDPSVASVAKRHAGSRRDRSRTVKDAKVDAEGGRLALSAVGIGLQLVDDLAGGVGDRLGSPRHELVDVLVAGVDAVSQTAAWRRWLLWHSLKNSGSQQYAAS